MTTEILGLPPLLTCKDVAEFLRTSIQAIYSMKARGQLPGVVAVGRRRFLVRRDLLLMSVNEGSISSANRR